MPNAKLSLPSITEQDRSDILFGLEEGIDFIAASFIRDADGVREIRHLCCENGGEHVDIFPKIECALAVYHFDEILKVSDGIMVARGDLGVEVAPEVCPTIQKEIIAKCNAASKPVITATQMLDSMIRNPRPTRAEVTDVATRSTTARMRLCCPASPPLASTRSSRADDGEHRAHHRATIPEHKPFDFDLIDPGRNRVNAAVGLSAVTTAFNVGAKAILTPTNSGRSARSCPISARCCPSRRLRPTSGPCAR